MPGGTGTRLVEVRRDGGVADTPLEKQKEGERRCRGRKREREWGEKMGSFFCSVFEFLTSGDVTNFLCNDIADTACTDVDSVDVVDTAVSFSSPSSSF